jgi:dihydroflavonol-4-reductase
MTRILVTGGSGFIGKHLVSALIARGGQVSVLDLQPPPSALPQVQYVRGSVLDRDLVDRAMDGVHEVYHLAGLPGMWLPRKTDFHTVNYGGTEIVIGMARKRGIKRVLHCSTESILFRASPSMAAPADDAFLPDDMPGPYTRSKLLADRFAMQAAASGYPVVIGCPTMPVGPHDHNVTPPVAMLRHFLGKRLQLYLDFVVNLVDVRDAAEGLILAMERGQAGHRYILGGESMPLRQVLELMAVISGRRARRIQVTGRVAEISAAMLEFIADHVTRRPPSGTAEGVRIALRAKDLSIEKAQRELGYAPGPVEPVLRETIAHLLDGRRDQTEWDSTPRTGSRPFHVERRFGG